MFKEVIPKTFWVDKNLHSIDDILVGFLDIASQSDMGNFRARIVICLKEGQAFNLKFGGGIGSNNMA